jgi:2'-5' RNA ligase
MPRCFVALDIGPEALQAVAAAEALLEGDRLRRVAADSLHVTIKYLGEVSVDDVARPVLAAVVPLIAQGLPELGDGRIDGFPSLTQAHVIVLTCSDPLGSIAKLAARADEAAAALGVEREARPFRPHLTLARAKAIDLTPIARRFPTRPLGAATRLTLYESRDSRYIALVRHPVEWESAPSA